MPISSSIVKTLRSSTLFSKLFYGFHIDDLVVRLNFKSYNKSVNDAIKKHCNGISDKEKTILINDIKYSYYAGKFSPSEYFMFKLRNKSSMERNKYLSDKLIYIYSAKASGRKLHDEELEDKYNFYLLNASYFKRDVTLVNKNRNLYFTMARNHGKLILKPNEGSCGGGIKIEYYPSEKAIIDSYERMVDSGIDWVAEELIAQSPDMAVWNESSINTVRISSFLKNGSFNILCPFMRMGRKGVFVDNGGQGGIFAAIDVITGKIVTDGKDEFGNSFECHPDSNIRFKDWQVPQWNVLIKLVEEMHRKMSRHRYIAWDFALSNNGWVVVEGNWGEFVAQQSLMERGYKKEFMNLIS